MFGWVLFRAESLSGAAGYLQAMFKLNGNEFIDNDFVFYVREYAVALIIGVLLSTPVLRFLKERFVSKSELAARVFENASYAMQMLLFIVSVSCLVMNAHNPFIYFNF